MELLPWVGPAHVENERMVNFPHEPSGTGRMTSGIRQVDVGFERIGYYFVSLRDIYVLIGFDRITVFLLFLS